jgi:hypothetical protein
VFTLAGWERKREPWRGFVGMTAVIEAVGRLISMLFLSMRSRTEKYLMLMYLVRWDVGLAFLIIWIVDRLSWKIILDVTLVFMSLTKSRIPQMEGTESERQTSSLSDEERVVIFCLLDLKRIGLSLRVMRSPQWPLPSGWTATQPQLDFDVDWSSLGEAEAEVLCTVEILEDPVEFELVLKSVVHHSGAEDGATGEVEELVYWWSHLALLVIVEEMKMSSLAGEIAVPVVWWSLSTSSV